MGILRLPMPQPLQTGVVPNFQPMVTTDNLATITAAGYLNPNNLMGFNLSQSNMLEVFYDSDDQYGTNATYGLFQVTIANGVITLVADSSEGGVVLPTTADYFASFTNTTGTIKSFYYPSDVTKQVVSMLNLGPVTSGNVAKFVGVNGSIGDAGFALHSGTTAPFAGGSSSNAFVTTNMTSASIVTATILAQTNTASIIKVVPGTNTLTVTFSADPGANTTINWISVTAVA